MNAVFAEIPIRVVVSVFLIVPREKLFLNFKKMLPYYLQGAFFCAYNVGNHSCVQKMPSENKGCEFALYTIYCMGVKKVIENLVISHFFLARR